MTLTMEQAGRVKTYAGQRGISTVGATKNATNLNKLAGKLTPRQRRRLAKKAKV